MGHEELFNYVVLYVFFELVDAIRLLSEDVFPHMK